MNSINSFLDAVSMVIPSFYLSSWVYYSRYAHALQGFAAKQLACQHQSALEAEGEAPLLILCEQFHQVIVKALAGRAAACDPLVELMADTVLQRRRMIGGFIGNSVMQQYGDGVHLYHLTNILCQNGLFVNMPFWYIYNICEVIR